MKKLDDLFRRKLKNYVEMPSEETWTKISEQLSHHRRKGLLFNLSVAASITAILSVGIYLFVNQNVKLEPESIIAEIGMGDLENEIKKQDLVLPEIEAGTEKQIAAVQLDEYQGQEEPQTTRSKEIPDITKDQEKIAVATKEQTVPEQKISTSGPVIAALNDVGENEAPVGSFKEGNPIMASTAPGLPPVVITYRRSLPITKTPEMVDEKEKENTWERVIMLAQDIKNIGFGLSDLRQAKDNLLDTDLRRIETRSGTNNQH
jgi:hypothetical protein